MAPSTAAKGMVGAARGNAAKGFVGAGGGKAAKGIVGAAGGKAAKGIVGTGGGKAAKGIVGAAGGKAAAAEAASTAGALTLKAAGFTKAGPEADSLAAAWMSGTAIANGGHVPTGSLYSFVQATAMGGGLLRGAPAKLTVGAVVGAGVVVLNDRSSVKLSS